MKFNLKKAILISALISVAFQATAMEQPEQEDVDSVAIQIANQSTYPVLVFRTKNEPRNVAARWEGRHLGRHLHRPRASGSTFESQCFERMFIKKETDSEPFTLDTRQKLYISLARGLYEVSISLDITSGLLTGNIVRTVLYTYNSARYPSRVTMLENSRKILVIINPDGEVQLVGRE